MTHNEAVNDGLGDPKIDRQMKACLTCEHRQLWGAGSRCKLTGKYIGYLDVWDMACRRWKENKRKPGEIEVYTEPQKEDENAE